LEDWLVLSGGKDRVDNRRLFTAATAPRATSLLAAREPHGARRGNKKSRLIPWRRHGFATKSGIKNFFFTVGKICYTKHTGCSRDG